MDGFRREVTLTGAEQSLYTRQIDRPDAGSGSDLCQVADVARPRLFLIVSHLGAPGSHRLMDRGHSYLRPRLSALRPTPGPRSGPLGRSFSDLRRDLLDGGSSHRT